MRFVLGVLFYNPGVSLNQVPTSQPSSPQFFKGSRLETLAARTRFPKALLPKPKPYTELRSYIMKQAINWALEFWVSRGFRVYVGGIGLEVWKQYGFRKFVVCGRDCLLSC